MSGQADVPALAWPAAREVAWRAGAGAARRAAARPLAECDGGVLADDLRPLTDLPAFPTSMVDGWAVRGPAPWRITGRVLAGQVAAALEADGTCVEIATGAMVPEGTAAVLRVEESTVDGDLVTGVPREEREWRAIGEEASRGDVLVAAGTPVTPAVIGLAAAGGHDHLPVRPQPCAVMLVFGDELRTEGLPGDGRVRDSLGPQVPAWLRRYGARMLAPVAGPIEDTLDAHVEAVAGALKSDPDLIVTTGGTMHGPVDHLHPALNALGATYVVDTVEVRPGFPMLLATLPKPDGGVALLAGLPGNPQSAIIALATLVGPALAGLTGRPLPTLPGIRLGAPVPGRGAFTHLALVSRDGAGDAQPLAHAASSMLRGLARSIGFAVVRPGTTGSVGDTVPLVPLPLLPEEAP